ncbi:ATP-binding protein [Mycolicibacterium sp.]|uniref:sensor histidine kinase n=1 Tax=Mycolicibacterium sp. TaxID=2320850 RepID=UPI0028AACEB5|nr:ATP-binding protein [Mycolicibacterium sp.]
MRRLGGRVLDFLTIEPLRIRSILRLILIALIALLVHYTKVEHRNDAVFTAVLIAYAVGAVAWLIFLIKNPARWWFGWASTFTDVAIVLVLCIASGPATISLYPIFFLLPISVAFLDSPVITGLLGLSASFGYLLAWAAYATQDQEMGGTIPALVYVQVGCLLWFTAAITALSFTLARRRARVLGLLDVRRRLIAESMRADERNNRELSEHLHDGPLQNLLAARLDLDELRDNPSPEGFDRLDAALRETVTALRTTVATLHPQVLSQLGLTAAVRDLTQRFQQRWGTPVQADLEDVGRPDAQALIHRAARELLSNAHKHSRATSLEVKLHRRPGGTVLQVSDDGVGFDPAILARRVSEGHIGLASLVVAVEAVGGSMDFSPHPGGGTLVKVTVPDQLGSDHFT